MIRLSLFILLLGNLWGVPAHAWEEKELVTAIHQVVVKHHPEWREAKVEVTLFNGGEVAAAIPDARNSSFHFRVEAPPVQKLLGKLVFPLTYYERGLVKGRCYLLSKIKVFRPVVVLREKIARGTKLTSEQVTCQMMDIGMLPDHYVSDIRKVLGKEVKNTLAKGSPLMLWMVREEPLFRRGEPVEIQAHGEGFMVTTPGVALQDGVKNEKIKVRNLKSGKIVRGMVRDKSWVEVAAPY